MRTTPLPTQAVLCGSLRQWGEQPEGSRRTPFKRDRKGRGFQPANGATTVDEPHALRRSLVLAELTLSWSLRQDGTPTRGG